MLTKRYKICEHGEIVCKCPICKLIIKDTRLDLLLSTSQQK